MTPSTVPQIELIPLCDDEILPPPKLPKAIVYPWNADKAVWHELRFSLRSIDQFFQDKDCPIFILGTRRPTWLLFKESRVTFIPEWSYRNALVHGVQLADEVLWMNDDILLLKPTTWADVERTLYVKDVGENFLEHADVQDNAWRVGAVHVLKQLAAEGFTKQKVFSTHTPYCYSRDNSLEILKKYAPFQKMPFELAYFHHYAEDPTPALGIRTGGLPFEDARFLNYVDRSLTRQLKQAIKDLLPDYAPWELNAPFQI